jgi:Domain of unknown function (DUF4174)
MKVCVLIFACLSPAVMAQSLDDYQWKKRVLVVTHGSKELAAELVAATTSLAERDVEVFVLSGPLGNGKVPVVVLGLQLRERLKIQPDKSEVVLLGKDGRTVVRWVARDFKVAALLASIDAMPMRKREMKQE